MAKFWKTFWTAVVSLAGVVGLYLGALAVDLEWAFYAVLGFALLIAAGPPLARSVITIDSKLRKYPKLLQLAGTLEVRVKDLSNALLESQSRLEQFWKNGVTEGRNQTIGIVGSMLAGVPQIMSIASIDGTAMLITTLPDEYRDMFRQARYKLVVEATGQIKGIVAVEKIDLEKGIALMRPVAQIAPDFWELLQERAVYESTLPPGYSLAVYTIEDHEIATDATWKSVAPGIELGEQE